jgi:hypothetical protein
MTMTRNPPSLPFSFDTCLERICQQGCSRAYQIIHHLERDEHAPELDGATPAHREQLLEELKRLLSVYEASTGDARA